MIGSLRQFLRPRVGHSAPAIPEGRRVYAVGDIHGRLDLLTALASAIEMDDSRRSAMAVAETTTILLGDLVDRGPDSAGVLAFARRWQQHRKLHILLGNHEEMLLESLENLDVLRTLLRHGGRETAISFGIDSQAYTEASFEEVQAMLRAAIPAETLEFIASFEDHIRIGDYLFVHAGIVPGKAIEQQSPYHLRWIREPFLSSHADHGAVVVHGHTIFDEASLSANRIGIDTGAYASGRLTALGLEGTQRWLIEARDEDGAITTRLQILNSRTAT